MMPPRIRRRITSAKREEIERRQNEISQSIVRPFEVYSGLPVSFNPPSGQYEEVFKQPLTAKDSGVLYLSLMKSRYNYVFICPMFKLYWIKQSSYAKKLAELDKPLPKSSTEENLTGRQPVLGSEVSARDAMAKLCDAFMSFGPHFFEIRLFIGKDERSEKPPKKGNQPEGDKPTTAGSEKPMKNEPKASSGSQTTLSENKEKETKVDIPQVRDTETPVADQKKSEVKSNDQHSQKDDGKRKPHEKKVDDMAAKEKENEETTAEIPSQASTQVQTEPQSSSRNQSQPSTSSSSGPQTPVSDPNNMQSIENTIMISNLNAIARTDTSLNSLMKVVASGNASPQEILKFQGYIKRAREMGPQAHHACLFNQMPNPMMNSGMDPNRQYKERKIKEKKTPKSRLPKDQKLTAFQEKYLNNAKILFEYVENPNIRFHIPQKSICEVIPPSVELSEDAKEEENSERRDILISSIWIHNQNELDEYEEQLKKYEEFMKPEDDKEDEDANDKEGEEDTKVQSETLVTSEEGNTQSEVVKEGTESKETEASNTTEEQKENNEDNTEQVSKTEKIQKPVKKPPPRKARRKGRLTRRTTTKKKVVKPEEPEIRFTTFSFTIHNIPLRFVPIIVNSFEPVEKVQEYMKDILKRGTRLANFYLWYQVDGKLDEKLAESIRVQLNQQEKKMQGISTIGTAAKKRKIKEKSESTKKLKSEPVTTA